MILESSLLILLIIILIIFLRTQKQKPLPDGLKPIPIVPGGLPFFGHIFKVTPNPFQYLNDLRNKNGPIYSIQLGWKNIIVLNNYDIINKTLKEQGKVFSGRWQNIFTKDLALDSGILFKDKEWWAVQRAFTLRNLKDFGFGKRAAEDVVIREVEKLIQSIRSKGGKDIITTDLFSISTVNIISDFIMKKEFEETDENVLSLISSIKLLGQAADINSLIMNLFPIFDWFPSITKMIIHKFHPLRIIQTIDTTTDFIGTIVEEHRKRFKPENECHDLIDSFLFEQYKLNISSKDDHSFTDWQLTRLISELFLAGYETTSTTLSWTFLLLAKFPFIQKKFQEEIANVIGLNRPPTMADKKLLNYGQAVIDEIYRFSTVLPLAIAHRVFEDAIVDEYFIPANTIIFPNLYACHRDPSVWEKPYDFYPEHFLDEFGKYKPKTELITFGLGKRQCLGESLAKLEEFILLISIIQKFEISLGKTYETIDTNEILKSTNGTFRSTLKHKLNFKEIFNKD